MRFYQSHYGREQNTDDQNGQPGRHVVGAYLAEVFATVCAMVHLLQVPAEQIALAATGAAQAQGAQEWGATARRAGWEVRIGQLKRPLLRTNGDPGAIRTRDLQIRNNLLPSWRGVVNRGATWPTH